MSLVLLCESNRVLFLVLHLSLCNIALTPLPETGNSKFVYLHLSDQGSPKREVFVATITVYIQEIENDLEIAPNQILQKMRIIFMYAKNILE